MTVLPDHRVAEDLAHRAGQVLLAVRDRGTTDAAELKALGDSSSHEFLMAALAEQCPNDRVLSEEGKDDPRRLSADRVWIVDPLDGTREFSETGRTDWAVHVALWERGALTAGAVAMPARGRTLSTAEPTALPERAPGPIRLAVSRTRPPALVQDLAARLGGELVPMGSAGVKAMAVLTGTVDAYVHGGGQYEWDSAAPVAVARASGLHTSRLDGAELAYNLADPWLPDLLVCRPELADELIDALA
jgi:3'(2'), 5'-bisphosphate nucleotidase